MLYIVSHPDYVKHQTGFNHPEQPLRTIIINNALEKAGLKNSRNTLIPRMAEEENILLCHTPEYYQLVKREVGQLHSQELAFLSTGDAVISQDSLNTALLAVGGVLTAIDQVMLHPGSKAFCIVRPPGHHACSNQGMGFCMFNNVAIGARYAQQKYDVKRVLIVDWDVHHGNGTQEIFYDDPSVFYFSTHEKGNYPHTGHEEECGKGAGLGFNLNIPISPGSSSRIEVVHSFEKNLKQRMETFQPELVLISSGFDAHEHDPLGHFNLKSEDFFILTKIVKEIADQYAGGRIVSVLEGGYNLEALSATSIEHIKGLV